MHPLLKTTGRSARKSGASYRVHRLRQFHCAEMNEKGGG